MAAKIISKPKSYFKLPPNLPNYEKVYKTFKWPNAYGEIDWFEGRRLNAAHNAIDRHALGPRKNKVALYWEGESGERKKFTFDELAELSNKFANLLKDLGVGRGDRVFFFLPRVPELYFGFLGAVKTGAIAGTMFAAFGPQALLDRLQNSGAKVFVTNRDLRKRVDKIRKALPELNKIIEIDSKDFQKDLAKASDDFKVVLMKPTDPAFMLYTSGTTGKPKGVVHTHQAIIEQHLTSKWVLDIHEEDIYWCVPPDTTVIANPEPKPVREIKVGEEILGHDGKFTRVLETFQREYQGDLVKIKARYSNIPMFLTPNHKVLAAKRKGTASWIPTCELSKGDFVLFPRFKENEDIEEIFLSWFVGGCSGKNGIAYRKKVRVKLRDRVRVDGNLARLVGYYVSEGSIGARNHLIQFAFNRGEEWLAQDVIELFKKVFGIKAKKFIVKGIIDVRVNSVILTEFFENLFGRVSEEKRLPSWMLKLSNEKLAEFIKGFWRGDGDIDRDVFRFCTTSPILAYQLRLIFSKLGILASFRRVPKETIGDSQIKGRLIKARHDCYYLKVGGLSLGKMEKILGLSHPFTKKRATSYHFGKVTSDFLWLPIWEISHQKYRGKVFNLKTETASYALDNMIAHNCTADPGWVTGIAYEILGTWSCGAATVVYEGRFDPEKWYQILEDYEVSVWYTAPTAIRMLSAAGADLVKRYDLTSLRHLCSVGEPLNPEAVWWGLKALGLPFHDNWWQTETGGILIANYPCLPIKPGSMGKPIPGIVAGVVDDEGNEVPTGQEGNLAIRPGWPSQMKSIWRRPKKFQSYFVRNWYITGDLAYKDKDGYFWFVGRSDDIIKTAGERVGPFEVESALVSHPVVVEAGVIGKPDPVRGEIIKAFVVLKKGVKGSEGFKEELQNYVKKNLAGHAYPREIEFIDKLPKTRSGKIVRRILKAREMGLPVGDISTLEEF